MKSKLRLKKVLLIYFVGLLCVIGVSASTSFGQNMHVNIKCKKKNGVLSFKTTPAPLIVKLDGKIIGKSGVKEGKQFCIKPGVHKVRLELSDSVFYEKEVRIVKGILACVCL